MKVIIAGGRNLSLTPENWRFFMRTLYSSGFDVTEVVSGACGLDADDERRDMKLCKGGDYIGEMYAHLHGLKVTRFYAKWTQLGKRAGMVRNKEMAEYADALLWLPGGPGTANMVKAAKERGLKVWP